MVRHRVNLVVELSRLRGRGVDVIGLLAAGLVVRKLPIKRACAFLKAKHAER